MTELHTIEWVHPNVGRVSEVVCLSHEGLVLRALHTLGIGCSGSMAPSGQVCTRCTMTASGVEPRRWIRKVAG